MTPPLEPLVAMRMLVSQIRVFSQTHKIDNIGTIANLVFPYICSFLLYK